MRIAICEDDRLCSDILSGIVDKWAKLTHRQVDVSTYASAEEFIIDWTHQTSFDILFLDIMMGQISGFDLAGIIRKTDERMIIVFVTGVQDYVISGYEVNAFRYVMKPIATEHCIDILNKAAKQIEAREHDVFLINTGSDMLGLSTYDIYYFGSDGHYVIAHTNNETYRFREKLGNLLARLPQPMFCQCHRTLLVNVQHIHLINREKVQLRDKARTILPVSATYWPTLNQSFLIYNRRRQEA